MKNIIIVDDERNVCMILENVFYDAGYQVASASNGFHALEKMKSFMPDIVLLDRNMPRMDGLTTLRHIRKEYPRTIVVMMSANDDERFISEAMNLGASDCIAKPFDNDEILSLVGRLGVSTGNPA